MEYSATVASAQVLQQAIEKAGSLDSEKVKKALEENEFKCILGKVKYVNEEGYTNLNNMASIGLLQWQKGKLLFVYPKDVAEGAFEYPISGSH